jgi:4-amino-4-deoxy-L-arabinose transferase-like glycosyltransferase
MIASFKNFANQIKWISLFGLWALHGIIAFGQFQILSINEYSLPYFVVRMAFLAWIALNFILIIGVYRNTSSWFKWRKIPDKSRTLDILFIVASILLFFRFCLWIFQGLLSHPLSQQIGGYLGLLTPALNLMGYVSLEIVVLFFFLNLHLPLEFKKFLQKYLFSALIIFTLLGFTTLIVSITGLGILSGYKGDWQRGLPAVALLEWQVLLACVLSLIMFFLESKKKIANFPHIDVWICVAIWLGASMIWLSQPVFPNALALKPREPNFEIYPFNDAQTYDEFAQSALVGNGFGDSRIPQRPLYVVFLIISHVLFGQSYSKIIFFQTLVFAIFPVLLYLFGREFFSRSIGLSIALLAILRDYTSNLVSPFTGNITYSKLYLSEIPTAIFLILFVFVGVRWIKAGFPMFSGLLLGGILGSAMLIRTQAIVALPLIILFSLLSRPVKKLPLIKSTFLMLLMVALVVAPWLWRNWNLTGELVFDSPESQTINLALRYSRLNGVEPDALPLPGETNVEYITRLNRITREAIVSNPLRAVWGISNAFVNHGVNNILLLPLRNNLHNLNELWIPTSAFWERWDGTPNFSQSVLIALYIFLFGLGLTTAWIRNRWLGLLPLALNLGYNFWTSLALLSGQRFMLTMDWSIYLYYMIGLFTLFGFLLYMLNGGRSTIVEWVKTNLSVVTSPVPVFRWQKYLMFGVLFFGIGLSLPLSEKIFPNKYPLLPHNQLVNQLLMSSSLNQPGFNPACFQKITDSTQLNFIQGRAIFPRYYAAGEGERFTDSIGYKVVDEGRLVFDLVGQANGRFIFKTSHQPDFFPQASDVTLISSENGELWFVFVKQGNTRRFYISDSFDLSICQ